MHFLIQLSKINRLIRIDEKIVVKSNEQLREKLIDQMHSIAYGGHSG